MVVEIGTHLSLRKRKRRMAAKAYVVVSLARSQSNPDRFYEIRYSFRDSVHYCTCPAWKFQRKASSEARTCKHLKALGFELADLTKKAVQAVS
jgi:hypothetical protein|tara:strand:+ start:216 stop:494 length:279 start_codon:yes stop_codon:yes gene_type:complete